MANPLTTETAPFLGDTISTIGSDNTFATLKMRRIEEKFELLVELTTYYALSGHYEYEVLGREIADDEDEAIAIATDLEYDTIDKLKILDIDYSKDPRGFPEALQDFCDAQRARITKAAQNAFVAAALTAFAAPLAAE
jgi:hypothetical protein